MDGFQDPEPFTLKNVVKLNDTLMLIHQRKQLTSVSTNKSSSWRLISQTDYDKSKY